MYDIITFGSASKDIRIRPADSKLIKDNKDFSTGQGICFNFGSKIEIEEINFSTGGGGTNTAASFAKQGFKTAYCGAVGKDLSGQEILNELKGFKIDTKFVLQKNEKPTNHSIVISGGGEDRTIFVYRGAAELVGEKDIPWNKLKAKWIYLAPLTGLLCDNFEKLVNFAYENKIKIAANPSMTQLSMAPEKLKEIFSKIDILFLNQEEASFLTKIPFENETEIFKKLDEICKGIAVMTKGGEGVVASDGKYLYSALPNPDRKIVDTTGAGDSFASGFLCDFIRFNGDIEKAIQLGLANSAGNLAEIGAKSGLLTKDSKFERVNVAKQLCGENNLCLPKN